MNLDTLVTDRSFNLWVAGVPLVLLLCVFVLTRRPAVAFGLAISAGLHVAAFGYVAHPERAVEKSDKVVWDNSQPLTVPLPGPADPDPDAPPELGTLPSGVRAILDARPVVNEMTTGLTFAQFGSLDATGGLARPSLPKLTPAWEGTTASNLPKVTPEQWDSQITKLVDDAGGKQDGPMTISLIWFDKNDLDLHVLCPDGKRIWFREKEGGGGKLDVDRNAGEPLTVTPVENVSWADTPPRGRYKVFVQLFEHRPDDGGKNPCGFLVRVKFNNERVDLIPKQVKRDPGTTRDQSEVLVYEFDYPGK